MNRSGTRRAACALLACLALLVGSAAPAAAGDVRVRHTLFGVHDKSLDSFATLHPGSVRLWQLNAAWRDVETTPGHYNWTLLDHEIDGAHAAHVSVTMVVALTPSFYASEPSKPPRDITHYQDFIKALMLRYGTRISAYQVWNEANVINFWSGTMQEMAQLTKAMWQTRNEFDPSAEVVAPPLTARLGSQLKGLSSYESQRVDGVPVWHYYDVAAFNLYPLPTYDGRPGVPEDSLSLLAEVKRRLHQAGVPASKPIWNTEVNYGLLSGALAGQHAEVISEARQASNVLRTYLLNAAHGVKRVFWFRYDMGRILPSHGGGTIANTLLSVPRLPTQLTTGGGAYLLAQQWMHGRLIGSRKAAPCPTDRHGTYTCTVTDSTGTRRIYWNPFHRAKVRLAPGARKAQDVLGFVRKVQGGSRLTVNYQPVMVRH
jgi:polysaccharide biosynthesis protein PslG